MPMPPNKFSGPPPGPTPQGLSAMMPQGGGAGMPPGMPPGGMPQGGPNPAPGGGGGGLKDVFDEVQNVLDALAMILPAQAEEIDMLKTQLSGILAKAISGGASFQGRTEGPAMRSPGPSSFPG